MKHAHCIRVSKKALLHNVRLYERVTKLPIAPVLKSNAYGHGLREVASVLNIQRIPFFVLNSVDEVHTVRRAGVRKDVLVIGFTPPAVMMGSTDAQVIYTVHSLASARALMRTKRRIRVHIKLDTGMSRQGVPQSDFEAVLSLLIKNKHIHIEGLCSHFADADGDSVALTKMQIASWEQGVRTFQRYAPRAPWLHISATSGSYYASECTQTVARLGVGLYGFDVSHGHYTAQPALELTSILCNIKKISKGTRVGYNGTYTADRTMTIATIPLGYFEGIDRRLSNKGWVSIRGVACPIIGRVSMNITTVDVSRIPQPKEGERVCVIAMNHAEKNSVHAIAEMCDTITYEIIVHLNESIPRAIV